MPETSILSSYRQPMPCPMSIDKYFVDMLNSCLLCPEMQFKGNKSLVTAIHSLIYSRTLIPPMVFWLSSILQQQLKVERGWWGLCLHFYFCVHVPVSCEPRSKDLYQALFFTECNTTMIETNCFLQITNSWWTENLQKSRLSLWFWKSTENYLSCRNLKILCE